MQSMGVTAYEMTNAIKRMSEVLSRLEYHSDEITAIKDDLLPTPILFFCNCLLSQL